MIRPSDMVGRQYLATVQTPMGEYRWLIKAFDEQDARDQLLSYLNSEGIPHSHVTMQAF